MNGYKALIIIPARGGSKGIPHKNIKELAGKPLIYYTIDAARQVANDKDICVSTDDDETIKIVESYGLSVPFKRPDYLATDTCGTYEVLLHALDFYEQKGIKYDIVILLQTTSPFRQGTHILEALKLYSPSIDMVVSVKDSPSNPYYDCFEEDKEGFLEVSKGDGLITRRQDAPKTYQYNGAIYIINPDSLKHMPLNQFRKRVKYYMDEIHSIDIDSNNDWIISQLMIEQGIIIL